jgi:hypothetical protein
MDRATASRTHQRWGKDAGSFPPRSSPIVGHLSMRQRSTPKSAAQPSTKSPSCAADFGVQLGTCERRLQRWGKKQGGKQNSPTPLRSRLVLGRGSPCWAGGTPLLIRRGVPPLRRGEVRPQLDTLFRDPVLVGRLPRTSPFAALPTLPHHAWQTSAARRGSNGDSHGSRPTSNQ